MPKLSNKKIREIRGISFTIELLEKYDPGDIAGRHWTDTPPDMWNDSQTALWDMMFENEERLKHTIIKLLGGIGDGSA